jgi:hypothetical protein
MEKPMAIVLRFYFDFFFLRWSYYVSQAALAIILLLSPQDWHQRHKLPP